MQKKQLSDMSQEELCRLFPIVLKEHDPRYKEWYETERQSILDIVKKEHVARISHIGSSAVEGLMSKPTIDILLEMHEEGSAAEVMRDLGAAGWMMMAKEENPMKMAFNKGYTPDGLAEKVFHLHVRRSGDWDELYFRDYLIAHPDAAAEYEKLKQKLQKEFEYDRDGYTDAKSDFIVKCSALAKEEFRNRYGP